MFFCIQRAHFRALSIVLAACMLPVDYPAHEMYLLFFVGSKSKNCEVYGMVPSSIHGSGPLNIYKKFSKVHGATRMQRKDMYLAAFLEKVAIFFREKSAKNNFQEPQRCLGPESHEDHP